MLVLDVGNTKSLLCRIKGEIDEIGKWSTSDSPDQIASSVKSLIADDDLIVVSVVPEQTAAIIDAIPQAQIIDSNCKLPFKHDLDDLSKTGADRLCNMAAVAGLGWDKALVIDAGTATTFDVMIDGVFIGGLIAPGMSTAARALTQNTAQLPDIRLDKCELAAGKNSETAIRAGAYHTGIHGIMGTAWALTTKYGDLPVVLTGGLSDMLEDVRQEAGIGGKWLQDKWWTLRGAAVVASINKGEK
ncbi:type III pantothenate kinase [bacterium]|jgi:type III pantothenate kinase|nr:type III pantothenate kinase [bacterium]